MDAASTLATVAQHVYTIHGMVQRYERSRKAENVAKEHYGFVREPNLVPRTLWQRVQERKAANPKTHEVFNGDYINPKVVAIFKKPALLRNKFHFTKHINKIHNQKG